MTPSRALLARSRCSERGSRVISTRCSVLPANSTARLNGERGERSIKRNSSSATATIKRPRSRRALAQERQSEHEHNEVGATAVVDAAEAHQDCHLVQVGSCFVGVHHLVLRTVVAPHL